jgi:formylglycine-generating enzyme required for sulfatase activity
MSAMGSACPSCGSTLAADARFCHRCGHAIAPAKGASDLARPDTEFASTELAAASEVLEDRMSGALPPIYLREGTVLSVYRIESVIGEGGMGVVYRARDLALGRDVALKCLHMNLTGDPEVRRRFVREARVLRTWHHPGAVAIYDFIEQEHVLAIVMELVEGDNLAQHLARWRGKMPYDQIRAVFGDVLLAMDDAHTRGVVHRDLKPDNVLVRNDAGRLRPKIADFGIAKVVEGTTYTVSGALLGTCRYMSPEQVRTPSLADHRSDIYSLGITLYELVTGKPPFDGSHFSVMMAHVTNAPRAPSKLRPDVPPALERLILDALAKAPDKRPPSCAEFRDRLFEALPAGPDSIENIAASSVPLPPTIKGTGGHEKVLVPAGSFAMGRSAPNVRRDVHIDAFYMDRLPVTNAQFAVFLDATQYKPSDAGAKRFLAHWRNGKPATGDERHPVVYVSWFDARAYATWAGQRLPTEAEWEKAARGTDGRRYPWGRTEPKPTHANFGRSHDGTTPVGAFPEGASPYGILDLAGNVWEWCEDAYDEDFYEHGPNMNPKLASSRSKNGHVMRGGSFMYDARALRTYARMGFDPHYRFAEGGFRCVKGPG